jgi:hypothetical protein
MRDDSILLFDYQARVQGYCTVVHCRLIRMNSFEHTDWNALSRDQLRRGPRYRGLRDSSSVQGGLRMTRREQVALLYGI